MAIEGEVYGTSLCGETFIETSGGWVLPTEYSPKASSPVTIGYERLNARWEGLPTPIEILQRGPTIVERVSKLSLIGRTKDVVLDEFAAFHRALSIPLPPSPNKPSNEAPPRPPPPSSICEIAASPPPQEDPIAPAIPHPITPKPERAVDETSSMEDDVPAPVTAADPPVQTTRARAPRRRHSTLTCGSSQPPTKLLKSRHNQSKGDTSPPNKRRKGTPSRASTSSIRCTYSNCSKTFTRAHDRLRHIDSVHSGEKAFPCMYCPQAYARKDALRRHLTTCPLNPDPNKAKGKAKLKPSFSAGKEGIS